jgi:hypothetical protein
MNRLIPRSWGENSVNIFLDLSKYISHFSSSRSQEIPSAGTPARLVIDRTDRAQGCSRPFAREYWMAVCDVKTYFMTIAKRPHWNLIREIFFPEKTAPYVQSEWVRRKKQFARFDNEGRLTRLLHFYAKYQSVFAKVLQTRIPIWASPHREEFERLVSLQRTEDLFS